MYKQEFSTFLLKVRDQFGSGGLGALYLGDSVLHKVSRYDQDQYACEHLNQTGRMYLTEHISAEVLMLQEEVCVATNLA